MAVVAAALIGAMIVDVPAWIALVGPVLVGGLSLILLVHALVSWPDGSDEKVKILHWSIVAFTSHLAFGLVVTSSDTLRRYLGSDSFYYHAQAVNLLHHWTGGFPSPQLPSGKEGYFYLLAGAYWIFGAHAACGVAINAALAAALVPLLSDVTQRLFGTTAARYAAVVVVLSPGLLVWTSQLLREAAVLFVIAVALNCAVRLTERFSLMALLFLAVSLASLFSFRGYLALVIASGVLAGFVLGGRKLISGVGTGMVTLSMAALVVLALGIGSSGYKTAVNVNLEQANSIHQSLSASASGFGSDVNIATPSQALSYLPVAIIEMAFGPFPWQLHGVRQLPALPDVLFWWYLLPSLWRGFRAGRRRARNRVLALALPILTTTPVLALTVGNFGLLERERSQIFIMAVPFIALGLSIRAADRAQSERDRERTAK